MIQTKGDYKDYRRMDDARYVKSKYLPVLLNIMVRKSEFDLS